jgi:hypothetical protein
MSRWKMLETWDRDIPTLTVKQLVERLHLAQEYEAFADRSPGRSSKARRDWRVRREAVEAELAGRGSLGR